MKLSTNFQLHEFLSEDDPQRPTTNEIANLRQLAEVLEILRLKAKRPLSITSGFRSRAYNIKIGGAANSMHTTGLACDIETLTDMYRLAALASTIPQIGGVGIYPGRGFIHVDIRKRPVKSIVPTWWAQIDGRYVSVPREMVMKLREHGGMI